MRRLLLFGALVVVALGVGLWVSSDPREPTAYDLERSSMSLELTRTLQPFKVAFRVLFGVIVLITLAGLGWGGVRWVNRRADTVYPDRAGLYPIREGHIGGAKVFHDPNRAVTGSTVYASGEPQIEVRHPLPEGQAYAQHQVTGQAQAAQALRAAVSGTMPFPAGERPPIDALLDRRLSRPLPEVKALEWEPSHIERLLHDGDRDE